MGLVDLLRRYHIMHTWKNYEERGSLRVEGSETGQQNYGIIQDIEYGKRCVICGKDVSLGSRAARIGGY